MQLKLANLSPKMLKSTAENSASPLATCLIYQSAQVITLQHGKRHEFFPLVNKYRTISIRTIPVVSKTLEKHVKALLEDHMKLHSPISPRQWGFMSSRSTVSALIQVIDDWSRAVDEGYEVCIVFFYVKKAFDSVPHVALLKHLQYMHVKEYIVK